MSATSSAPIVASQQIDQAPLALATGACFVPIRTHRVTAIDPVAQLVSAAEQAGSADAYKIAAAADLPFENCSFDLAVGYNVLMDVEDVPAELKEVRRVLRPSGTLCYFDCAPLRGSRAPR
jgi:ubiquinone/menaquinone biosynthesis C-methylase UbiE